MVLQRWMGIWTEWRSWHHFDHRDYFAIDGKNIVFMIDSIFYYPLCLAVSFLVTLTLQIHSKFFFY
jgi:hypothetical protein